MFWSPGLRWKRLMSLNVMSVTQDCAVNMKEQDFISNIPAFCRIVAIRNLSCSFFRLSVSFYICLSLAVFLLTVDSIDAIENERGMEMRCILLVPFFYKNKTKICVNRRASLT